MTTDVPAKCGPFKAAVTWLLLAIGVLVFFIRGPVHPWGLRLWDFAVCAGSSRVWLHGGDPYDLTAVDAAWRAGGAAVGIEPNVGWLRAIVPPPTLVVLAPFAALPNLIAAYLYLLATLVLTAIAAIGFGRWAGLNRGCAWRGYAAAILASVPATLGLMSGNPGMLAVPLILIGLLRSRHRDDWLGGALLGLGTALKVQIGLPLLMLWLFWDRWRTAVVGLVVFAMIAAVGPLRMSLAGIDWWSGWTRNVAQTNGEGGLNDFATAKNADDLLNLQVPLWHLTHSRTVAQVGALLIPFGVALAFAAVVIRTGWGRRLNDEPRLIALAAGSALLLLPVYHRAYDGMILIPALALAVGMMSTGDRRTRLLGGASLLLLASLLIPPGVPKRLAGRSLLPPGSISSGWFNGIFAACRIWCLLALTLVLAVCYRRTQSRGVRGMAS